MKKYKLIKQFPDGPELGQVAEYQEGDNNYFIKGNGFGTLRYRYTVRSIEENPEFWEEVKEKDWEIIELRRVDGSDHTKEKDKIRQYLTTLKLGNQIYWFIHSIKRLSDGEVFTVGDKLKFTTVGRSEFRTIKRFDFSKVNKAELLVFFEEDGSYKDGFRFEILSNLTRYKEPILKTEDGFDLYEGDKYWTVFNKALSTIKPFTLYGPHRLKLTQSGSFEEEEFNHTECLYFAQLDNAANYIQKNKPKTVYGVNGSFTKTSTSLANKIKQDYAAGDWKWFNSEKERDLYIEENKPRFSKRDMINFGRFTQDNQDKSVKVMYDDWVNPPKKK